MRFMALADTWWFVDKDRRIFWSIWRFWRCDVVTALSAISVTRRSSLCRYFSVEPPVMPLQGGRMRQDGILEQAWWWLASYLGQPATMPSQATRTYIMLYHKASEHQVIFHFTLITWDTFFYPPLTIFVVEILANYKPTRNTQFLHSCWMKVLLVARTPGLFLQLSIAADGREERR